MGGFAWVTLATNDSYSLGALVLAHSLKEVGTAHQTAVLITPGVTSAMRDKLTSVFNVVQEVNILDSRDEANLRLLKRPELGITFTKLHCWRLTQFEKCVFLDADTLVLQNSDELFEREELSAAPDVGWPDCFNSGVFVYRPSLDTYEKLIQFALERGSFDGGDQGLLNLFFADWAQKDISRHLPFIYNVCSTACYSYLPAFKQFGANAKIIHFIGAVKPWLQYFNTETKRVHPSGDASHLTEFLQRWWDIFCTFIHPVLSPAMQAQSQHGTYPSYFPPQYDPPPNPTASTIHYEDAWDPWDEYDAKLAQTSQYQLSDVQQNASYTEHQPQSHQNVLSPQSYITVYVDVSRVPTPPPSPPPVNHNHVHHPHSEPTYQHQEPHYHHQESHYHYPESKHHQESEYHQPHHSEPFSHSRYEESQDNRHSRAEAPQATPYFYDNTTSKNNRNGHIEISQSFPHNFESPIVPILNSSSLIPNEGQTTTIVSNESALNDSLEPNTEENAGLAGAFSQLTLGVARTPQQDAFENVLRKQAWEVGNIDYLGKDSFANIWSKISQTLAAASPESQPTATESALAAPNAEPQVASVPAESQAQSDVAATPVASVPEAVQAKPEQPAPACPLLPKETPVAAPVETLPVTETKTEAPVAVAALAAEPLSPEIAPVVQTAAAETAIINTPTTEIPEPSEPVPTTVSATSTPSTPVGEVPKSAEPAPAIIPSTPTTEVPKPAESAPAIVPSTPTAEVPKPAEPAPAIVPSTPTAEVPKAAEPSPTVAPSTTTVEVSKSSEPAPAAVPSTPTAEVPKAAEPSLAVAPSTAAMKVPKSAEPAPATVPSTPTAEVLKTGEPSLPAAPSTPITEVPKPAESVSAATPSSPIAEATPTETAAVSAVKTPTAEVAKSVETPAPISKPKAECPKAAPAPTPEVKAAQPPPPKAEGVATTLPVTSKTPPVKTPQEVLKTPETDVPPTPPPSGEPAASAPKKTEKPKKSAPKPKK